MNVELTRHEEQRLSELKTAVAARLKHVCDGMPTSEFDALVEQIVHFKIRWGESLVYDNPPALGAWMFNREQGDNKK